MAPDQLERPVQRALTTAVHGGAASYGWATTFLSGGGANCEFSATAVSATSMFAVGTAFNCTVEAGYYVCGNAGSTSAQTTSTEDAPWPLGSSSLDTNRSVSVSNPPPQPPSPPLPPPVDLTDLGRAASAGVTVTNVAILARYSTTTGATLWQLPLASQGDNTHAFGASIFAGGYLVAGCSTYKNNPLGGGATNQDVFVFAFDTFGGTLWGGMLGGTSTGHDCALAAAASDAAGVSYVTGYVGCTTAVGTTALFASIPATVTRGGCDAFVMRLSASGRVQWVTLLGGSGDDRAVTAAVDTSTGDVIVGGSFASQTASFGAAQLVRGGANGTDGFIARLASNGTVKWVTQVSTAGADAVTDVAVDASTGSILVSGSCAKGAVLTLTQPGGNGSLTIPVNASGGSAQTFVARLGGDGRPQWAVLLAATGSANVTQVAADSAGNAVFGGNWQSNGTAGSALYAVGASNTVAGGPVALSDTRFPTSTFFGRISPDGNVTLLVSAGRDVVSSMVVTPSAVLTAGRFSLGYASFGSFVLTTSANGFANAYVASMTLGAAPPPAVSPPPSPPSPPVPPPSPPRPPSMTPPPRPPVSPSLVVNTLVQLNGVPFYTTALGAALSQAVVTAAGALDATTLAAGDITPTLADTRIQAVIHLGMDATRFGLVQTALRNALATDLSTLPVTRVLLSYDNTTWYGRHRRLLAPTPPSLDITAVVTGFGGDSAGAGTAITMLQALFGTRYALSSLFWTGGPLFNVEPASVSSSSQFIVVNIQAVGRDNATATQLATAFRAATFSTRLAAALVALGVPVQSVTQQLPTAYGIYPPPGAPPAPAFDSGRSFFVLSIGLSLAGTTLFASCGFAGFVLFRQHIQRTRRANMRIGTTPVGMTAAEQELVARRAAQPPLPIPVAIFQVGDDSPCVGFPTLEYILRESYWENKRREDERQAAADAEDEEQAGAAAEPVAAAAAPSAADAEQTEALDAPAEGAEAAEVAAAPPVDPEPDEELTST